MNELEKKAAAQEPVESPVASAAPSEENVTEAAAKVSGNTVESESCECAETESPAEALSEASDNIACERAQAACVETESPAEAISEATDRIAAGEEKAERRFHEMDKQELVAALENIVATGKVTAYREVSAIKQAFFLLHSRENDEALARFVEEGGKPEDFTAPADELEGRLRGLVAQFKQKRTEWIEADEARRRDNLKRKKEILAEIDALGDDIDNINLKFPEFQRLQQEFKDIKDVPPTDETEIWKKYQLATEQFYDRLKMNKELRDLDFRKNLEAKEALIAEAEALADKTDVVEAFRALQELHNKWRELGPVAKELREDVWARFKAASLVINKRHQDFFEARKAAEAKAEEVKKGLLEELRAIDTDTLDNFNKWIDATKKVLDVQARWKATGFASKKVNTTLYADYRQWCDSFFEKKSEYFTRTRAEQNTNLEQKTALCEKAEALAESVKANPEGADIADAVRKLVKMQEEWKKVGPVARKQSDALWKRFHAACNYLFDIRKKQSAVTRSAEHENLAAKRAIIERIRQIPGDISRNEGIARLKELQAEWQNAGHVPFKMKDQLFSEYREACDALYETLNLRRNRARMSSFENRVEKDLSGDNRGLGRERDRLLRQLEAKKSELKTMENNMGFFNVKSSAGSSMLKDLERRMAQVKEEMNLISQKISLLDEKIN